MTKYIFIVFSALVFLSSCEDHHDETRVKTHFQGKIDKRNINLQRLLSGEFTTVDDRDGGKRTTYLIEFDRDSKMNFIIDKVSGDTLLKTLVSKYKKLWYLQQERTDSTSFISALKIENNYIRGWNPPLKQMKIDQGFIIDEMVEAGKLNDILLQKTESNYYLNPDKRILKTAFTEVLDSMEHHIKLFSIDTYDKEENEVEPDEEMEMSNPKPEKYIKNIYPNPVTNNFTLELLEEGNYLVQLYNKNGQIVKGIKTHMEETIIDVTDLEEGTYIVALQQPSNRRILDKKKIVIIR